MKNRSAALFGQIASPRLAIRPGATVESAVVLGASVAGLLAARVLSDHVKQVTLIDRDDLTVEGDRPGASQGRHLHLLLATGLSLIEGWFPGFTEQALARGACAAPAAARRTYFGRQLWPGRADAWLLTATRPMLESLLRDEVRKLPSVRFLKGRAAGLEYAGGTIVGVTYVDERGQSAHLAADVAVDAMGRASRLSDWLRADGFRAPVVRRVGTGVNYATALFDRGQKEPSTNVVLARFGPQQSPELEAAAVVAVEGGRWMVTLAGAADQRPGHDPDDFLRRCRNDLPAEFAEAVRFGLTDSPRTYRLADSRRRDYTGHGDVPAGLFVLGDAVASFNPIHAQGMTCAALQASCLDRFLRSQPDLTRPAVGFFALQRLVVDAAWTLSTADVPRPVRQGLRPRLSAIITRWVSRELTNAALRSVTVGRRFEEVNMMMRPPRDLFSMKTVVAAMAANRLRKGP